MDIRRSRSFSGRGINQTGEESPEIDPEDFKESSKPNQKTTSQV